MHIQAKGAASLQSLCSLPQPYPRAVHISIVDYGTQMVTGMKCTYTLNKVTEQIIKGSLAKDQRIELTDKH